jgi:hypothetical protein
MEVTPEIYAWLSELKILNIEKTLIMKKEGILVDDSLCIKLTNGFFWEKILINLEKLYNKFYKIKLNYTHRFEDVIHLQEQFKGNNFDKTLRYEIWKIIGEVITNFGIEMNEEQLKQITEKDYNGIKRLLKTIYLLSNELTKRNSENNHNNSYMDISDDSQKKKSNERNNTKNNQKNIDITDIKNSNGNGNLSNSTKINPAEKLIEKKNEASRLDEKGAIKKTVKNLKKPAETLDLNTLTEDKKLENSESPLEFFILTLSKNLEMKPRQSVALLSNNRKYLIKIANRGIKGNYSKMINWYQDVVYNYHNLISIINSSQMKDAKSMTYAVLSVGLYSKSSELAEAAAGFI